MLALAACQKYEDKGAPDRQQGDRAAAEQAIKADEAKWNQDFHAKDAEALLAHYSDDVTIVFPGEAAQSGMENARKTIANAVKDPNFDVSFTSDKIDVSGDLAYSRGRYSAKMTDPRTNQASSAGGTYLTVYKRQDDGSWKVTEDITTVDPNPPAAAAR
ncbi:MAG TPA: DUF4440 domain-containing protein [Sphingomicrobium sp.]|nr:DUF4440 domain-containing protein [Sphingomicrobium sp.]